MYISIKYIYIIRYISYYKITTSNTIYYIIELMKKKLN